MAQITQIDHRWKVSGDVLIGTVAPLLTASNALTIADATEIDFAGVTDIDTSTISLIFEWKRRAQKENRIIQFVNLPANLTSLTQLYGVAELIN
jgi:phospholipid transport system transporter-binding protein